MKELVLNIGDPGLTGEPRYYLNVPGEIGKIDALHLQNILSFVITLLLTVAIILSFFFVIFGGLRWMLSQGDKKKVEEAQKTVTFAIVGLVLTLLSFFIINIIGYAFGVPLLHN